MSYLMFLLEWQVPKGQRHFQTMRNLDEPRREGVFHFMREET